MNRFYKFLLFSLIVFFGLGLKNISANSINKISMDINIDKSGTAKITEIWDVEATEKTEIFKPYENLEDMVVSNLKVTDDTGRTYTDIGNWDINASFDDKAYKSGINYTDNGLEICWGISQYGTRTYNVTYEVTNFVRQLTDSQLIYFGMIKSMPTPPADVYIMIKGDGITFNETDDQIWVYGDRNSTIYFVDGGIEIKILEPMTSDEYIVPLVKIKNGKFSLTNISDKDFKYYEDLAKKGSSNSFGFFDFLGMMFSFIVFIITAAFFIGFGFMTKFFTGGGKRPTNYKMLNIKDVNYFREIPTNKDLLKAYWVADIYNMYKDKSGLMGAILLKWIRDDLITITKTKKGIFDFKDNNYAIDLTKITKLDNTVEQELYEIMKEASGDGILETKEFLKWSRSEYQRVLDWFDSGATFGYEQYKTEQMITETVVPKKVLFFNYDSTSYQINQKLQEEVEHTLGLKKFLLDYGSIPDKPAMEVKLWEEYLMYAAIFGIADKVAEQFSKLYPDFKTLSNLDPDVVTPAIIIFSHSGYDAANTAKTSSGSGGGGFSGGGGGSFGGSSGGGFR